MMPLMPSPGSPNTTSTPQACIVSTRTSETVLLILTSPRDSPKYSRTHDGLDPNHCNPARLIELPLKVFGRSCKHDFERRPHVPLKQMAGHRNAAAFGQRHVCVNLRFPALCGDIADQAH